MLRTDQIWGLSFPLNWGTTPNPGDLCIYQLGETGLGARLKPSRLKNKALRAQNQPPQEAWLSQPGASAPDEELP
ncbi:MAG: hypothetical protein DRI48_04115 [Chloroflexi bacterium]|nr:MAG: hypothetical protein DRI48_04115 [Chloroflexota bacterium]